MSLYMLDYGYCICFVCEGVAYVLYANPSYVFSDDSGRSTKLRMTIAGLDEFETDEEEEGDADVGNNKESQIAHAKALAATLKGSSAGESPWFAVRAAR